MTAQFDMIHLADLLRQSNVYAEIDPEKNYRLVTVKLWGKGVEIRSEVEGTSIIDAKLFVARENQFILSKIDARNGAFGLIPPQLDKSVVSTDFPVFELNTEKVLPDYLNWMSKTKGFVHLCAVASEGTTNRVRLKIDRFLASRISLPSIEEQRRIVARIEELAAKIEEARGLRREVVEETGMLERQAYQLAWSNAEKLVEEPTLLEYIADVIDPQPDHRTPAEILDGMPYVSIANIDLNGKIDSLNARKVSPFAIERQEASFKLQTGDIVLGKIGTVGAARPIIVNDRFALSANVVLVQPHRKKILDIFLLVLLRAPQAEQQFTSGIHSSAQGAFGIKKMRKLSIPVPPLFTQISLMERFTNFHSNVDFLMLKQSQTSAELNALLPSILDKAFKGEL